MTLATREHTLLASETISGRPLQLIRIGDQPASTSTPPAANQPPNQCPAAINDSVTLRLVASDYATELRRRAAAAAAAAFVYAAALWSPLCLPMAAGRPGTSWALWQVGCLAVLAVLVMRVYWLIESETISLSRHLALQVTTTFAFGRRTRGLLLSLDDLHDIVVNEVFDNLRVIYVLNALTKGKLYAAQPIISLLSLKPRADILTVMYRHLQAALGND